MGGAPTAQVRQLIGRLIRSVDVILHFTLDIYSNSDGAAMCQICRVIEDFGNSWYCAEGDPRLQSRGEFRRFETSMRLKLKNWGMTMVNVKCLEGAVCEFNFS